MSNQDQPRKMSPAERSAFRRSSPRDLESRKTSPAERAASRRASPKSPVAAAGEERRNSEREAARRAGTYRRPTLRSTSNAVIAHSAFALMMRTEGMCVSLKFPMISDNLLPPHILDKSLGASRLKIHSSQGICISVINVLDNRNAFFFVRYYTRETIPAVLFFVLWIDLNSSLERVRRSMFSFCGFSVDSRSIP